MSSIQLPSFSDSCAWRHPFVNFLFCTRKGITRLFTASQINYCQLSVARDLCEICSLYCLSALSCVFYDLNKMKEIRLALQSILYLIYSWESQIKWSLFVGSLRWHKYGKIINVKFCKNKLQRLKLIGSLSIGRGDISDLTS